MNNFRQENQSLLFTDSEAQKSAEIFVSSKMAIAHGEEISPAESEYQTPLAALQELLELYPEGKFIYIQSEKNKIIQTYQQTWEKAKNIVAQLQKLGINPGNPVILQLEHYPDFVASFWGCIIGGFVPVPVPIQANSNQVINQLEPVFHLLDFPPILTTTNLTWSISSKLNLKEQHKLIYIDCLEKHSTNINLYHHKPEELGFFLLSSGTTGKPKIVTYNARTLVFRIFPNKKNSSDRLEPENELFLNWLPLEHIMGIRSSIPKNHTIIHLATNAFLQNPLLWLDTIEKYQIKQTASTNFALALILEALQKSPTRKWDISSIEKIAIGAETINHETAKIFLSKLAFYGLQSDVLKPGYGMSECGVVVKNEEFYVKKIPDVGLFVELGKPTPGHSVRIVDQDNQLLPENHIGRIQVRGPSMTSGYYKNPELNQDLFTADGWINTGDLGFLDKDSLTVTGREKEIIIINALKYPSAVIEMITEQVTGVTPGYTVACAVRQENSPTDELAVFFHPSLSETEDLVQILKTIRLQIIDKLGINPLYLIPLEKTMISRTETGKIKRLELKENLEKGNFNKIINSLEKLLKKDCQTTFLAPRTPREETLVRIWQEVLKIELIGINDNFFVLGGNSLLATQVMSRLEQLYSVHLAVKYMFEYPTIEQLGQMLGIIIQEQLSNEQAMEFEEGQI